MDLTNHLESRLHYPCPPRMHPESETVGPQVQAWIKEQGLASSKGAEVYRRHTGTPDLASLAYPTVSMEDAYLVGNFFAWLFLRDDDIDQSRDSVFTLTRKQQRFSEVLNGAPITAGDSPDARALASVLKDLTQRAGPLATRHFARQVNLYLEASLQEAVAIARGARPMIKTYEVNRRYAGAVYPCFMLNAVFTEISPETYDRQGFLVLMERANSHICMVNDLFSVDKEIEENNYHNKVLLLMHHEKRSRQEAVARVVDLCNAEAVSFAELKDMLCNRPEKEAEELTRFAHSLEQWMSGNIRWSATVPRYASVV